MDSHPLDPSALVFGLLFAIAGAAIFADRQWGDVDMTAFTAAGVAVVGLLLAGLVVARYLTEPNPDELGESMDDGTEHETVSDR